LRSRERSFEEPGFASNANRYFHETAHALGIDYQTYTREQADVMVDTTAGAPMATGARSSLTAPATRRGRAHGYTVVRFTGASSCTTPLVTVRIAQLLTRGPLESEHKRAALEGRDDRGRAVAHAELREGV